MKNKLFFNEISFHDCKVHAFGYDEKYNQFLLDVDYISSEWILKENGYYSFNIVPATFVFENAWDINIDVSMDEALIIDDVIRDNSTTPKNIECLPKNAKEYDWTIEFLRGEITLKSIGLFIYKRQDEWLQKSHLTMDEREGVSLKKEGTMCQIE